jgi:ribonucleoside-diphosphate reductase alpha chain
MKETVSLPIIKQLVQMISLKLFMPSSPTLFNSGKHYNQLSSCFISTIQDDLGDIFKAYSDNAQMSKFAGGIGNDWTNIRATGSNINKTDGKSQGLIPFLKISNDVTLAVDQSGKRRGANCAYLEPWHLEIEEFIDLKKNTGDERRRCHDMNTALWCPDLFFERIKSNGEWTLFCPSIALNKETGMNLLHESYGEEFDRLYEDYEKQAKEGKLADRFKTVKARELWKKILGSIYETGHPWITFKDSSNRRYPAKNRGVIHSSNLCCEIFLHNSSKEISVCNLCSINIHAIYKYYFNKNSDSLDATDLITKSFQLVNTDFNYFENIVLFMNRVIDNNYYPVEEAKTFNMNNRPIGIGLMGFQDLLFELNIPYDDVRAVELAGVIQKQIMYHTLKASSTLCQENKLEVYPNFEGSDWSKGILPCDTVKQPLERDESLIELSNCVKKGVSNSTFFAIAPTVTISNICGVYQSIEPCFSNIFVKGNIGGNFTVINKFLVKRLQEQGLWNQEMLDLIKFHDGSIQEIDSIDQETKRLFKTAFELDQKYLIKCTEERMKWIDMGQSLNLYVDTNNAKQLSDLYLYAYELGLKSTYYVRTKSANTIEKSTIDTKPKWSTENKIQTCNTEGECDACQ